MTVADIPIQVLCTVTYISITYFMTGQPLEAYRMGLFTLICLMVAWVAQGLGLLVASLFDVKVCESSFGYYFIPAICLIPERSRLWTFLHLPVPDLLGIFHPPERCPPGHALVVPYFLSQVCPAGCHGGHLRLRPTEDGLRGDLLPFRVAKEVSQGDRHGGRGYCRGCDCTGGDLFSPPDSGILRDAIQAEEQELNVIERMCAVLFLSYRRFQPGQKFAFEFSLSSFFLMIRSVKLNCKEVELTFLFSSPVEVYAI